MSDRKQSLTVSGVNLVFLSIVKLNVCNLKSNDRMLLKYI